LDEAQREAERLGIREAQAAIRHERAELARHAGRLDDARRMLDDMAEVVAAARAVASQVKASVETSRGYLAGARGDFAQAQVHHDAAVEHALYSTDAPVVGHTLVGLAHLAAAQGKAYEAATLLGAATGIRGARDYSLVDLPQVELAALSTLGEETFAEAYQRGLTQGTTIDGVKELLAQIGPREPVSKDPPRGPL
jgi:hypothetical protein